MGYFDDILIEEEPRKPAKQASSSGFFDDILGEDEASRTKREYVEQGGKPEDVYSPERLQTLVEQGPAALAAEPPLKRQDGSIAGPTLPTEEALAKGLIEKNAEPAVRKAMAEGVETVSSGFDREKGVGFAVGRDEDGKVVRVEEKPKKQTSGFFDDIIGDDMSVDNQSLINQPIPNPIARESVGRFAKGAIVEPAAALARTYGMAEAAIGIPVKGEPYPVESTAGGRLARGIEALGERIYPPVKEAQGSFIPEVAGGLGQVTGMVAGGVGARALGASAAVAERAVPMATGVVMGAGEGVKRSADAKADPEAQLMSGFLNGAVGLSEVFPTERWISKIDKATGGQLSTGVKRYLADIGAEATTEAIQEAFQSTMGNIIAKGQYNPDQEIGAEVGRSATVGGTVGGIASAVIGAFGLRGRRTSKPTPDVATNEPQAESVQPEVQAQPQQEGLQPFTEFQRPDEQAQTEQEPSPQEQSVPTKESVVLSAGEKARLTRLDTIEGDIRRLKENDPDQTPYYDERLNQIQSEKDNIIRKAERPTKALAEDILQPDETGYDIIDFIQEQGGILSKKKATEQKNISLYGKKSGPSLKRVAGSTQPAEYDGMPDLRGPYTGLMKGSMPVDEMAQMAYDNLGVGDGTSGGLWQAVGKAIDSRRKTREYNQGLRQTESQRQAFRSALFRPKVGDISYQTSNLQQGDIIRRGNEDFRVTEIDPETFDLTIQGPTRYGKRVVKSDAFIFADRAFRGSEPLRGVQVRKGGKPSVTPSTRTAQPKKEDIRQELKTRLDDFRRTFQDKFVDVENLQKRVAAKEGPIPDYANIKQAEELYHGRVGEQLTDFDENQARPIVEDLGKSGISAEVFDRYATAKHAKERNAVIAQRFPNDPAKQDGGSGMTNAEADRVLRSEISQADQAKLEPIRQRLLDVNRQGLRNRYEAGLISRDTYELLTQRYKDYVPLMGRETGLAEDETGETMRTAGTGSGFDVRGSDIIMAEGRTTKASDIIAYSFQQYMDSVVRAEKNKVMQTAQQFAINYPNNGVIELLQEGEIGNSQAPDIIAFKDNGQVRYLRINDPKLADIMKNRASPVLGSFVGGLASMNRYFAFINTQASPEFVISNFARDLQTALVNINQNDAKGLATDLVKNIPVSLKATFRAELGTPEANNRMDLFYNEFKREGGRMTFFGLKDFATLQKQIQKEVARGGSNSATRVFGKALDFVGKANSAVENATRLATYATLRERGYTPKQSAYAARNITVNFTRKGTAGPLLNSFYLFFNANIQGSARIIQALATSKKAQRIMLGVMAFGFFRDILNRILGGEDETGVPFYDKIPEYTRRQNFVLMNPLRQGTGEYFKFPMPYGYSVFDYAGQLMASVMPKEMLGAGMSPMKASYRLSMAALDNFNPIGGSYSLLQAISPTITTPLVDLDLNMDFSGRPIMPTPNPFDPTPPPDSQRYWNNVSPVSKWVTEKINELTGGSKARAGAVDVSPETLDYAVEFLSGAVGKFGERLVTLPFRGMAAAQGDLPLEDLVGEIPMYRKLSGRVPSYVDISRYQEMRSEVLTIADDLKIAQQEGERAKAIEISREARPELRMVPLIKSTEQRLKELRSERRKLQETYKRTENEAVLNRIRANRERQKELMLKALDRYNSSVDDKM